MPTTTKRYPIKEVPYTAILPLARETVASAISLRRWGLSSSMKNLTPA